MDNKYSAFTVYKSSAGSGKTFTLVKEYIKLVMKNPENFRHILAVTFTNKAAAEMKERILTTLQILHNADDTELEQHPLFKELNMSHALIRDRAKTVLTSIIHNYSEFSVSTIDSFVQRISRMFARELGLSPTYEVELNETNIKQNIVDILISKTGLSKPTTELLINYTLSKAEIEKSWKIENDLFESAKTLFKDDSIIYLDKIASMDFKDFIEIRRQLNNEIQIQKKTIKQTASNAIELITTNNLTKDDFFQKERGIYGYFAKLEKNPDPLEAVNPNRYVIDAIENDNWYKGKYNPAIETIKEHLKNYYLQLNSIKIDEYIINNYISNNIYSMSLLIELRRLLDEYITENNIVPISEFNKKINEIIKKEPVPYIYARTGEKYRHLLVDEFQDTSELQWINLIPLFENAMSANNFNMIVGDAKQSIYRWRGANIMQFINLPEINYNETHHKQTSSLFKSNYKEIRLEKNYRSLENIIDFNNNLYDFIIKSLPENETIKSIYAEQKQTATENKKGGYINVRFYEEQNKPQKNSTYEEQDSKLTWYLQQIEKIINQNTSTSENKDGNYNYRDIAILCRKNKDGEIIAEYLSKKGINVISNESLLLKNNTKIKLLISLLQYISDDSLQLPGFEALLLLTTLYNDLKSTLINSILKNKNLNGKNTNTQVRKIFSELGYDINIEQLRPLPVYELCEELIRLFELNRNDDPYIITFLDIIYKCSLKNIYFINPFLQWWNINSSTLSLDTPEGINGVKIMSIHKSKGLQFPIVIYPFANDNLSPSISNYYWIELPEKYNTKTPVIRGRLTNELNYTSLSSFKEQQYNQSVIDNINLMYVATTRPEEQLYILADKPAKLESQITKVNDLLYLFTKNNLSQNNDVEIGSANINCITHKNEQTDDFPFNNAKGFISTQWKKIIKTKIEIEKDNEAPKEKGTLIHLLLSRIKSIEDIDSTIQWAIDQKLINKTETDEFKTILEKIIGDDRIKKYFQTGLNIKTECEILLPDGLSIIPDRMIINGKQIAIIDYKTGKESKSHKQQIDKYAEKLTEMGYNVTDKIIYYIKIPSDDL